MLVHCYFTPLKQQSASKCNFLSYYKAMINQFSWCLMTAWTPSDQLLYLQPWNTDDLVHSSIWVLQYWVSSSCSLSVLCQHISSSVVGLLALRSPSHTLQRPLSLFYDSGSKSRWKPDTFQGGYNLLAIAAGDKGTLLSNFPGYRNYWARWCAFDLKL